jgi:hypothetical protein
LNLPISSGEPVQVNFYDVSGRVAKCLQFDAIYSENTIQTIHLPAGVYFVTCHDGAIEHRQKIVVTD